MPVPGDLTVELRDFIDALRGFLDLAPLYSSDKDPTPSPVCDARYGMNPGCRWVGPAGAVSYSTHEPFAGQLVDSHHGRDKLRGFEPARRPQRGADQ